MKRKWWLVVVSAFAALGLSLCFFGVRVRIAPRLVLYGALNDAFDQLEGRFEESPGHMLLDVYNSEGIYRADLQLETKMTLVGPVRYDMDMQVQLQPRRVLGTGTVVAAKQALDLSVYMDGDFAAVSSDGLVEGNYYGICYDTFSQDVQNREVLSFLIGEETMAGWEKSVSALDAFMSRETVLPAFSRSDIRAALYAVLTLDPQVSREKLQRNGEQSSVHAVSFRATGQQIAKAAKPHWEELTPEIAAWIDKIKEDPAFYIEAVFYLDQGTLVQLEASLKSSEGGGQITAGLGIADEKQAFSLALEITEGEEQARFELSVENSLNNEAYQEKILFSSTKNGKNQTYCADYTYDLSSGEVDLNLTKDGEESRLRMHLAGEGEKLTVTTQDIAPLVNLFREKPLKSAMICTVSIMQGEKITPPVYRNLDQWSLEDLWTLIKGLGSLIGINLS
ncbi:MAG: hypothetical protein IKK72_05575 [Oscillospiraceae bacterium]|nr:hypothetical protein [Oscillospiraceae bacterium]